MPLTARARAASQGGAGFPSARTSPTASPFILILTSQICTVSGANQLEPERVISLEPVRSNVERAVVPWKHIGSASALAKSHAAEYLIDTMQYKDVAINCPPLELGPASNLRN